MVLKYCGKTYELKDVNIKISERENLSFYKRCKVLDSENIQIDTEETQLLFETDPLDKDTRKSLLREFRDRALKGENFDLDEFFENYSLASEEYTVVGYYEESAIIEDEAGGLYLQEGITPDMAPVGTVVSGEDLIAVNTLSDSEQDDIKQLLGEKE